MKIILIALLTAFMMACHNSGSSTQSSDSTVVNTQSGNVSDGGPNHGMGDTNSYDRMSNTLTKDTTPPNPDTLPHHN